MARTPQSLPPFKTKAFQDYYNRTNGIQELNGTYEFLQGTENYSCFELLLKFFNINSYCYSYSIETGASIHTFIISRKNEITSYQELGDEEKQLILESLGLWDDNDSIITFSSSINHYLTIINEG